MTPGQFNESSNIFRFFRQNQKIVGCVPYILLKFRCETWWSFGGHCVISLEMPKRQDSAWILTGRLFSRYKGLWPWVNVYRRHLVFPLCDFASIQHAGSLERALYTHLPR